MNDDNLPKLTVAGDGQEERKQSGVERVYRNEQVAVSWEPRRCIHTGYCFRGLPHVFKPLERPWVDVNAASPDKIAATVMRCPTGALHFERLDGGPQETMPARGDHDHRAPQWAPLCTRTPVHPPPGWIRPRGNPGRPVPLRAVHE
jgi:uncharacterized Fe-S cluster protein YjdI